MVITGYRKAFSNMIPAGYLLKRMAPPPEWLKAPHVRNVCSVSGCVNGNVVDVVSNWQHNSFGVANSPEQLWRMGREDGIDTSDAQLFFYEAYEREIDFEAWLESPLPWRPLTAVLSNATPSMPIAPPLRRLLGFDVIACEGFLDHSPLSCNSVAETTHVNAHALFDTLAQSIEAIESGHFTACEPGVYKIYSVYLVDQTPCQTPSNVT